MSNRGKKSTIESQSTEENPYVAALRPPSPIESKVGQKNVSEVKKKREMRADEPEEKTESSFSSTLFKILAFITVIAMVPMVPLILSTVGEYIVTRQIFFLYLWMIYIAGLLSVFFHFRKSTVTLTSFFNQLLIYGIFTLGAYVMVDIPRFLPFHLRQVCLYLWCSFTMPFNFLVFYLDDTNYQEEERKEKEKEERRKKKEEERKQKLMEQGKDVDAKKDLFAFIKDRKIRLVVNIFLYLVIIALIGYWFYGFYTRFQEKLESGRDF